MSDATTIATTAAAVTSLQNGNFIDNLFQYIMTHGWKKVNWVTIVNFYMYLSLDKIKGSKRMFDSEETETSCATGSLCSCAVTVEDSDVEV